MQGLRDFLRGSLARSLRSLDKEDRLAAALPLVCGSALASHCEVDHLDDAGKLHLRVSGKEWLASLLPMRETVQHDLQRVAGVPLTGLHFVQAGSPIRGAVRPAVSGKRMEPNAAISNRRVPYPRSAQGDPHDGQ